METNQPRKLFRSHDDRVIGGVAGGLGRYFDLDPILFRIGFVALAFLGGAGILLYLGGLLLVPSEPGAEGQPVPAANRSVWAIAGVVVLLIIAWPILIGGGLFVAAVLVPLSVLAIAGVLVWWLVSGEGPSGEPRDIAVRAAFGVGILFLSGALAVGGAIAAAAGGSTVVAVILVVAGIALAGGAFLRPVRWLILPALLLAVSAGGVSAAGVSTDGGVGDRYHRPASLTDLRDRYELGVGELEIDLRDVDLPPGDTPLEVDLGVGDVRIVVPTDVCVASKVDIGAGEARVLGRHNDGVDVRYEEHPDAPPSTSRLLLDAEIGLGAIEVRDTDDAVFDDHGFDRRDDDRDPDDNAACRGEADAG
ncbi:MAG: PspC domain-containing protein [Thermoleophilaceae bacterium]|nr:PspC domain-containing protein [Thermoleophilaceae bacterium]